MRAILLLKFEQIEPLGAWVAGRLAEVSLEERRESVRGAFATRPGSQVDNLRVLLVDDVLTTGATLDACARALREAGSKSVIGLTLARALRNPLPDAREW